MEDIWAVRFVVLIQSQAWSRSRKHAGERRLAYVQRVAPQVVAVKFDQVEGPHEHVRVVVPVPDTIEGCRFHRHRHATASPSMIQDCERSLASASTMSGKR